jgi:hypothetical protein
LFGDVARQLARVCVVGCGASGMPLREQPVNAAAPRAAAAADGMRNLLVETIASAP